MYCYVATTKILINEPRKLKVCTNLRQPQKKLLTYELTGEIELSLADGK
jgi:hypothetical protein